MGPKRVTQACTFTYVYDGKVALTILHGGSELLVAHFHGPTSLKCDTKRWWIGQACSRTHLCSCDQGISL